MGLKAIWKDSDIKSYLGKIDKQMENAIVSHFIKIGTAFVNVARNSHTYQNRTGNLESSIAFIVTNRGRTVYEDFKLARSGTERTKGLAEARKFINSEKWAYSDSIALIVVAGMHYAIYVEAKGYDVITGSSLVAKKMLKQAMDDIKRETTK